VIIVIDASYSFITPRTQSVTDINELMPAAAGSTAKPCAGCPWEGAERCGREMRLVTSPGILPCCLSLPAPAHGDGILLSVGFPLPWHSPMPPFTLPTSPLGAACPAHPVAPIPTLLHIRVAQQPPPTLSPITPDL